MSKNLSAAELRDKRLRNEYEDLMKLSRYSPLIEIKPLNGGAARPPTQYEIVYTCRGMSNGQLRDRFVVRLTLPAGYPEVHPDFRAVTPIDHPHVYPHANNWICVGHDTEFSVGQALRRYIVGVGEMIQLRRTAEGRSPVDERPLQGEEPDTRIVDAPTPLSRHDSGRGGQTIDIDILSGPRQAPSQQRPTPPPVAPPPQRPARPPLASGRGADIQIEILETKPTQRKKPGLDDIKIIG